MFGYSNLGAPEDFNQQAWSDYLTSLRQSLRDSWRDARRAYFTLKEVREQFGLPFTSAITGEGTPDPGAWNESLQEGMLRLQNVVEVLDQIATDALENKRRLGWDASGTFVIEKLPGDNVTIQVVNGVSEIVSDATGAVVGPNTGVDVKPVTGVGLPPVAIVAIVGIAAVAVYFTADSICSAYEKAAEEKTNQTLGDQQRKLVESGKATPAEAQQMTSAVLKGRAEIKKSEAAAAEQKPTAQLASTARTLGFVGLGVAAIWLAVTIIGRASPARSMALAKNPTGKVYLTRVRLDRGGYDSRGRYFGVGRPLYLAYSDEYDWSEYVRADTREQAKEEVRQAARRSSHWPSGVEVSFYREAA